ncbi:exosome complex exonuclease RRP42 [Drosophila sulfurigaster albostrigata]|uniref:exosome complex exonuclease RRP42 n=1 Tax=Drosophila nasuta TaxID=42062 RepID=UPI00295ED7AF|nr:exosome complex exonuclease RRP42 [Drosophila nasuta]XP_062132551.1 exosome complex exonuclease RRP42 [Drosophila sulfurigaster albostrigata]
MAYVALSEAEKTFILHGVEEDFRCDGRSRRDYRPMELETGLVSNASGSARLRLANTDILVGVKTEIDVPNPLTPEFGKLEFFVDCSANATPEFEGRGGSNLAQELILSLQNAYESPLAFDYRTLCLIPGQQCWKLYIDILILECGGNLHDAVSLAAKAALYNTKLPRVTATLLDAGITDLIISDNPYDCTRIGIDALPLLVTVCKIGDYCLVDPTAEEEVCSTVSMVVSVSMRQDTPYLSGTHMTGGGSMHRDTMLNCIQLGLSMGEQLNKLLLKMLKSEETRVGPKRPKTVGFLK